MDEMDMSQQMAPEAEGGYEICIAVSADGRIAVGVESGSYEAAEEQGAQEAGMEKPAMRQVKDIQEAIRFAIDAYKTNGQMPDETDEKAGFQAAMAEE